MRTRNARAVSRRWRSPRWRVAAAVLVAVLAVAAVACKPQTNVTVEPPSTTQQGISVTGTGTATVTPDLAVLNLGAQVTAANVADARAQAAQSMQAVIDAVKAQGVADKDIQTTSFSISPQYHYTQEKGQEITGYQVTNLVTVKVRKLDSVPAVLDAATQAGGNDVRVNDVSFTVENPDQYMTDARDAALKNAKAHAQTLADAAGVKLGPPISITESSSSTPPVRYALEAAAPAPSSGTSTPVSPGEQKLTVTVSVVYGIQ